MLMEKVVLVLEIVDEFVVVFKVKVESMVVGKLEE